MIYGIFLNEGILESLGFLTQGFAVEGCRGSGLGAVGKFIWVFRAQ